MAFGFFGKKKEEEPAAGASAAPSGAFVPQPEKARKWFDHGRTMTAASNFEYALFCFASGLKLDPGDMKAHEAMYETAIKFFQGGGKPAPSSEIKKIDGPGPVDRFVAAEFTWVRDINNIDAAMRLMDATAKAGQEAFGQWLAPKLLNMLKKQKKQSKSMYVKAKELFAAVDAWNEAYAAGEIATQIDPSDANLANELKQLSAQRALAAGGYAKAEAQQQGGFRSNIKDADRQKELAEQDSISAGADAEERNLERARKDFEDNPLSPEAVQKYGQLLRRKGTPDAEEEARRVYLLGFERMKEYRFRMYAGDIDLARKRREAKAAEDRGDPEAAAARKRELLELEASEFRERTVKYPTDRGIKLELGRIDFELGKFEDAMASFQSCKDEARYRIHATHMLGKCFSAMGWHTEAIGEFKDALSASDATERDRVLPLRYDLMVSLMDVARAERSLSSAKDAFDICSAIVRKDISYRDIREKRKEIDALLKELGG